MAMRSFAGNRLIKRLKRHASMATLFRMADSSRSVARLGPEQIISAPTEPHQGIPIIRATLVNRRPIDPFASDPSEPVTSSPSLLKNETTPVQVSRASSPESGQRTFQPSTASPAEKQEDRDWRRLQAIMRKHSEVAATESGDKQPESKANPHGNQVPPSEPVTSLTSPTPKVSARTQEPETAQVKQVETHAPQPASLAAAPVSAFIPGIQTLRDAATLLAKEPEAAALEPPTPVPQQQVTLPSAIDPSTIQQEVQPPLVSLGQIVNQPSRSLAPQAATDKTKTESFSKFNDLDGGTEKSISQMGDDRQSKPRLQHNKANNLSEQGDDLPLDASPLLAQADLKSMDVGTTTKKNEVINREQVEIDAGAPTVFRSTPSAAYSAPSVQMISDETPEIATPRASLGQQSQVSIPAKNSTKFEADEANLPLQSVWPVSVQPIQQSKPENIKNPPGEPSDPYEFGHETVIQRVLSNVEIGSPSDSPVELIVPRRPRPAIQKHQTEFEPHPESKNAPTAGRTTLQAFNESKDETAAGPRSKLIQTEIGPLPSDLWELIGQPAPTEPGALSTVDESDTERKSSGLIQREPADSSARPDLKPQGAPAIQRQDETPVSASAPSATQVPIPAAEPQNNVASQELSAQEKAELSQRVYSEIKRRLSIEWERLKRKH